MTFWTIWVLKNNICLGKQRHLWSSYKQNEWKLAHWPFLGLVWPLWPSLCSVKNTNSRVLEFKSCQYLFSLRFNQTDIPIACILSLWVPDFNALISGQKFLGGLRCGSTLSLWNALLKISILLHNMASDHNQSFIAIQTCSMKTDLLPIYEAECWFSRGHFTSLEYCHTSAYPNIFDHIWDLSNEVSSL